MWKPKTVATTDNVYTYLRLFNLNYSEPICCSRRLTFYTIENVKHKCHYIYNGINNSTDTKK